MGDQSNATTEATNRNNSKESYTYYFPGGNYADGLSELNLDKLQDRRDKLCKRFFNQIKPESDEINNLKYDFRKRNNVKMMRCCDKINNFKYDFRKQNSIKMLRCRTKRYQNSFVPYAIRIFL